MDALARILRDYAGPLARLVDSYERNATAREDLLQEIVVALVHAWPHFRGECSERTFVYRVAHNRAITHRTRRRASSAYPSTRARRQKSPIRVPAPKRSPSRAKSGVRSAQRWRPCRCRCANRSSWRSKD